MKVFPQLLLCSIVLTLVSVTNVLADEDPTQLLNRRVGTWQTESYQKKAEWTPTEKTSSGEETVKWVLDKQYIHGEVAYDDGSKGIWMMNFDKESEVYRAWYFGNRNEIPRGNTVGKWDEKTERVIFKQDLGTDFEGEMTFKFSGKNKIEWTYRIRDKTGKLMLDNGGTATRK